MKRSIRVRDVLFSVGLALAAILFCLITFPFASVESQSGFTVEYDTDRRFGDYKHFDLQEADHEVCRNHCAADANCKAYTYTKPWQQYPAHCWLKNTVPRGESGLTCCSSGVKQERGGGSAATAFGGTWDAYAWDVITIDQTGDRVTGRYTGLGSGTFQGTVSGDKLYFSFRTATGGLGEAVMSPIDANAGRYNLNYCDGRGCDPLKQGYVGAQKRR